MPWFITSIAQKKTDFSARDRKTRCFGFYNTYNEAFKAVEENRGNMEECLYDYIVMEYIEPGIHPMVHAEQWWQWDETIRRWRFLPDDEKPKQFIGICNWALG